MLAKDGFSVMLKGKTGLGRFFLMEKMTAGFNKNSRDWKYTLVIPKGSILDVSDAQNSKGMVFCYECHMAVKEEENPIMFLPEENCAK